MQDLETSTEEMQGSVARNPRQSLNEELSKLPRDLKKNSKDPAEENSMEFKQQPSGGSSNKRKRSRPRKLVVLGSEASVGAKHHNRAGHVEELVAKACSTNEVALLGQGGEETADASRGKKAAVSRRNGMTDEAGTVSIRPTNSADVGETQCQPGVTEVGKSLPEENQRFPFVKSSPIWKAIESMEVFTMMPQVPHFRPLYKCKEECREGLAIGNMVTFSGLVDKISKLQFDDRGSIFTSTLESLADLEKHGFNVSVLRSRVTDLLSIKDRQEQFRNKSKEAKNKIKEHAGERTKLAEEIDNISKKIIELQEKHALMKAQMESKDEEIAKLQQHVDSISQNIDSARLDFEKVAATPFKSLLRFSFA